MSHYVQWIYLYSIPTKYDYIAKRLWLCKVTTASELPVRVLTDVHIAIWPCNTPPPLLAKKLLPPVVITKQDYFSYCFHRWDTQKTHFQFEHSQELHGKAKPKTTKLHPKWKWEKLVSLYRPVGSYGGFEGVRSNPLFGLLASKRFYIYRLTVHFNCLPLETSPLLVSLLLRITARTITPQVEREKNCIYTGP